jgi:diphthine-ammonia ligase
VVAVLDAGDFLVSMLTEGGRRSRSHGIRRELLAAQETAVGIPSRFGAATWSGARIGIFGDIDMDEHREWEQAVCAEVGTEAIVPLWHRDRRAVVGELLDAGFVAVIVAVRDGVRPTSPLGRRLDAGWPRSRRPGADACGEGGEYHSFVVDGPIFRNAVEVVVGPMSLRDGVWFVDLLPARRPRTDREEGPVRPHRRSKSGRRCRQPPGASADLPLHDQRAHSAALRAAPQSRAVVEGRPRRLGRSRRR